MDAPTVLDGVRAAIETPLVNDPGERWEYGVSTDWLKHGWGLGMHLTLEDIRGMRRAGTGDWAGLFNSYFWLDREAGVGAAFFTQLLPFFDAKMLETLVGFELAVYAKQADLVPG